MNDKLIAQSDLFRGISPEEAAAMLHCLQAVERRYPKGALICRQGEAVPAAGLLLSGEVHIVQDDLWGNQSIFSRIGPGELFSEAYAAVPGAVSLVNAVAAQESSVLLLSVSRILHTCPSACAFHAQLIRNLLACVAQKNLRLAQRLPTLRRKPSGAGCFPIFRRNPSAEESAAFKSRFPASSSRITFAWSAAPFPQSLAKCSGMD